MNDETYYDRIHGKSPKRLMNVEDIEIIIRQLEDIRKRPQMYVGSLNADLIDVFLWSFNRAFLLLGYDIKPEEDVASGRGWDTKNALGLVRQMRQKKMSEQEIINELLTIEIGNWENILSKTLMANS